MPLFLNYYYLFSLTMPSQEKKEVRETTLVLAESDILIKHRRAYRNLTQNYIISERFITQLPVINAQAKDKFADLPTTINKEENKTIVEFKHRKPIKPGEICAAELSLLIDDSFTNRIGDLRIIDWPSEDLTDIHFLHTKPFFVSAIGKVEKNTITPALGFKSIISHARKGSTIRIEYLPKTKPIPSILWTEEYIVKNVSDEPVDECSLKFLVPRNDIKQKVSIKASEKIKLSQDSDGNAWANVTLFNLKRDEKRKIILVYKIDKTSYTFSNEYGNIQFLKGLSEPSSVGRHYLKGSKLWSVNDHSIQKIARGILEGQTNIFDIVKLIFEFVNQSFTYEANGVRLPADEMIKTKRGDCSEFSDLFVTLARACGIPARVCTGYFWGLNGKLEGHAWCEVFTKQGWIQLDPLHGFLHGVSFQHILFSKESNDVDYPSYVVKNIGGEINITKTYDVKVMS